MALKRVPANLPKRRRGPKRIPRRKVSSIEVLELAKEGKGTRLTPSEAVTALGRGNFHKGLEVIETLAWQQAKLQHLVSIVPSATVQRMHKELFEHHQKPPLVTDYAPYSRLTPQQIFDLEVLQVLLITQKHIKSTHSRAPANLDVEIRSAFIIAAERTKSVLKQQAENHIKDKE